MKKALIIMLMATIGGCATSVPVTSSMNDFVEMSIKPNSTAKVRYNFSSLVRDGKTKTKDRAGAINSGPGLSVAESLVFSQMLSGYMETKFATTSDPAPDAQISVRLKRFDLYQYSTDSTAKQVLVAFGGGEINQILKAKVVGAVSLVVNGAKRERRIVASSEDTFVTGVGTGTSTSYMYRGKDSIEHAHARNINKANNKFLMQVNAFLEENGL